MHLSVSQSPYTYYDMLTDLDILCQSAPLKVRKTILGYSSLGKPICVLIVGNPENDIHILIQGAIHGREYTTSRLLMNQALVLAESYSLCTLPACFHFLPVSNPDGVLVSQQKKLQGTQEITYRPDKWLGYTKASPEEYAARWKANGTGIDLNRNFPSGWKNLYSRKNPSSENYKGISPLCAPESRILACYTADLAPAATLSYHESGSLIYYGFGTNGETIKKSRQLGMELSVHTGYPLICDPTLSGGGFKDWMTEARHVPSLTIEVGSTPPPLSPEEYNDICTRNIEVPVLTALHFRNTVPETRFS